MAKLDRESLLLKVGQKKATIDIVYTIDFQDYLQTKRVSDVHMSVAPISIHLSRIAKKKGETVFDGDLNHNLLQVTIYTRAIIYDLNDGARAITDISDL